jgi:GT2 family glycosyltransferase
LGNLAGVPAARLPVRVVVLNHNGGEHTVRAFRHLSRTEWPADELELVCVDNASTDGSVEAVAAQMPTVAVRQVGRNEGFPANNHALRDLDGVRYVALVNNDAFVEPGWLAPLVEALDDDPGLGAACPKLVFAPRFVDVRLSAPRFDPGPSDPRPLGVMVRGVEVDGRDAWRAAHASGGGHGREADAAGTFEWLAPEAVLRVPVDQDGGRRATLWLQARSTVTVTVDGGAGRRAATVGPSPTPVAVELAGEPYDVVNNVGSVLFDDGHGADRGWLAADDGTWDAPVEVFAWCGGAVLLRPDYLADVGLFDERFFLYYEDTDLSWRGRARGWRYRTVPSSVVRHVHSASTGEGSEVFAYHVERNRLLMLVKDAPARLAVEQVVRHVLVTLSYARRDVVAPLLSGHRPRPMTVRRRLGAFVGFLRLLGPALRSRRCLRARQQVPDAELARWWVPR